MFPSLRKRRSHDRGAQLRTGGSYFWQAPHSMMPLVSRMAVWCTNTGYSVLQGCSMSCFLCLWAAGRVTEGERASPDERAPGSHACGGPGCNPARQARSLLSNGTPLRPLVRRFSGLREERQRGGKTGKEKEQNKWSRWYHGGQGSRPGTGGLGSQLCVISTLAPWPRESHLPLWKPDPQCKLAGWGKGWTWTS